MISVTGIGITKFGELWESSPRTLAGKAIQSALEDSGKELKDIDVLFVANMLAGLLGGQVHLGALFAEECGWRGIPAYTIEGACASGGLAVHTAITSILSGKYKRALVLGVEKMTDHKPEEVSSALMAAGSSEERFAGATFPGLYAILARAHMDAYRTTPEQLAAVAVKNHFHASLNPNAQYHTPITVKHVMGSACVADPLKLLDCSPITDGAAAVVLEQITGDQSRRTKNIEIISSQVATDALGLSKRKSLVELAATKDSAQRAFKEAGVTPADIDVAEVHDCFTIAEIMAMEDIGFFKKGGAARAIAHGETTLNVSKKLVVNTSGGLKACGHPVGATGVKQIVEIVEQLRGTAGKRQVRNARIGLTQNVGGSGGTAVVHILKRV